MVFALLSAAGLEDFLYLKMNHKTMVASLLNKALAFRPGVLLHPFKLSGKVGLGLALLFPISGRAQPEKLNDLNLPAIEQDLIIVGNAADGLEVNTIKTQELKVRVKNVSSRKLIVSHVGFNTPNALVAVTPLELAPDESRPLELLVDGSKLLLPGQTNMFLRVQDGGAKRTAMLPIHFTSKEIVTLHPRGLMWQIGDDPQGKASKVINLPAGKRIKEIKTSDERFTAKLEGSSIIVTPLNTAEARTATIVNIAAKPPARSGTVPPLPKKAGVAR
jgi:hypothetical protein